MTMAPSAPQEMTARNTRTTSKVGIGIVLIVAAVALYAAFYMPLPPPKNYITLIIGILGLGMTLALVVRNLCLVRELGTYYLIIAAFFVGAFGGTAYVMIPLALLGWFTLLWNMRDTADWQDRSARPAKTMAVETEPVAAIAKA